MHHIFDTIAQFLTLPSQLKFIKIHQIIADTDRALRLLADKIGQVFYVFRPFSQEDVDHQSVEAIVKVEPKGAIFD